MNDPSFARRLSVLLCGSCCCRCQDAGRASYPHVIITRVHPGHSVQHAAQEGISLPCSALSCKGCFVAEQDTGLALLQGARQHHPACAKLSNKAILPLAVSSRLVASCTARPKKRTHLETYFVTPSYQAQLLSETLPAWMLSFL